MEGEGKRRLIAALLGLISVLLLLGALWRLSAGREETWARIQRAGTIRIGYAIEPPYAFPFGEGEAAGESPEVARGVVALMGIGRVEWRLADFNLLIDLLESGEIDVIASGLFITPERERRVAFSLPTAEVEAGLLVARGNPLGLHSYGEVVAAGGRVAVIAGAVEGGLLNEVGTPEERILRVTDAHSGYAAIVAGRVDALALSRPSVHWLATHDWEHRVESVEGFDPKPVLPGRARWLIAYAFRRGDRRLLEAWNSAQTAFLGTTEAQAIAARYGFRRIAAAKGSGS